MEVRILDIDGGIVAQRGLQQYRPNIYSSPGWGPRVRMGCSFARFRAFEKAIAQLLGGAVDHGSKLTFCGSGDFHHVTLALLHRLTTPFNLLIVDNHPDWMRGVPFLHCGTWVWHASRLPLCRTIFHVGGDVDFDNSYRWLAPWNELRSGKITVFPAVRRFWRGQWSQIAHEPMRVMPNSPVTRQRLAHLLNSHQDELARWPLYVSLDKDVMRESEAIVNWDSGHLLWPEVELILEVFREFAKEELAGMDIVGDWSPVQMQGWLRQLLHQTEHPELTVNEIESRWRNERTNLAILDGLVGGLPASRERQLESERALALDVEQPA